MGVYNNHKEEDFIEKLIQSNRYNQKIESKRYKEKYKIYLDYIVRSN